MNYYLISYLNFRVGYAEIEIIDYDIDFLPCSSSSYLISQWSCLLKILLFTPLILI